MGGPRVGSAPAVKGGAVSQLQEHGSAVNETSLETGHATKHSIPAGSSNIQTVRSFLQDTGKLPRLELLLFPPQLLFLSQHYRVEVSSSVKPQQSIQTSPHVIFLIHFGCVGDRGGRAALYNSTSALLTSPLNQSKNK